MKKWIAGIVTAILITLAVYLAIALGLIASQRPQTPVASGEPIDFNAAITAGYDDLPAYSTFAARDGSELNYRLYGDSAAAQRVVLLVHGSGWHGMQFHSMARHIAESSVSIVAVPDLRGHGFAPARRGDLDHIGQFEEDLAGLIGHLARIAPDKPVILGGHSSGGGLAVRFAGGAYGQMADAFILLAPFLKYDAPTTRPNSGGWAHPATRRIIGLTMLNALGVTILNHLPVIAFAMPRAVLDGPFGNTVTTTYSYRLNTSFAPRMDYEKDLAAIDRPLLVIAGEADEAFNASLYEPVISKSTRTGSYVLVPDATHIGILTNAETFARVTDWLTALDH